jgi:uncharacterized protein YbjT (DUF2867 family)
MNDNTTAGSRGIAVIGASGTVGQHVVRGLSERGLPCTAVARTPPPGLAGLRGVTWHAADWSVATTDAAWLEGVEQVFMLTPLAPDMVAQAARLADVLARSGVQHVVRLSALGVGYEPGVELGQVHGEIERDLRERFQLTVLRPNSFMNNYVAFAGADIRSRNGFSFAQADGRVSLVDARDIAAVAVQALSDKTHRGRTLELTGAVALNNYEVAAQLSRVLGRAIGYSRLDPDNARQTMLGYGMDPWLVRTLCELDELVRDGRVEHTTGHVEEVLGRPPISFEDFVEHAREQLTPD